VIDLGPTSVFAPTTAAKPALTFTTQQQDRVRQWTVGLAYEGRWQGVGELSVGLQKTQYREAHRPAGRTPGGNRRRAVPVERDRGGRITPRLVV